MACQEKYKHYFTEYTKFDKFRKYGYIAAAGDRHLAEFCEGKWYLENPETVKSWKFGLTTVGWRKDNLKNLLKRSENLKTGKEVDFDYGNVAKVVSGSCAVPGIFSPVPYEGMHLIDGGLRNNVPADVVKDMGANVVFAIDVNHLRGSGTDSLSTISVLSSTIGIIMQSKIDKTMEVADLIFEPSLENFSPLKFEEIDKMIEIGYATVMDNKSKIIKMLGLNPKKIGKYFTKK